MNMPLSKIFWRTLAFSLFCHFPQKLLSKRIFPSDIFTQNVPISIDSAHYSDFAMGIYPYPGPSNSGALAFWTSTTSFTLWSSRWYAASTRLTLSLLPQDDGNSTVCCIQKHGEFTSAALLCTNGTHYLLQTQDQSIQKIFSGQDVSGNNITISPLSKIAYSSSGNLYVFYGINSGSATSLVCTSNGQLLPLIYTSTATTVHPAFFLIDQANLAYFFFIENSRLYWKVYDLTNKIWKTANKVLIPVPAAVFSGSTWRHNGVYISIQTSNGDDSLSFLHTDTSGNMYLCEKKIFGSSANLSEWKASEVKEIPITINAAITPQVLSANGILFLVFAPSGSTTLHIAYRYPSSDLWVTEPLGDISLTLGTQPKITNRSFFMQCIIKDDSSLSGGDRIDVVYNKGTSIYNRASADNSKFKLKSILDHKL